MVESRVPTDSTANEDRKAGIGRTKTQTNPRLRRNAFIHAGYYNDGRDASRFWRRYCSALQNRIAFLKRNLGIARIGGIWVYIVGMWISRLGILGIVDPI